MKGKDNPSGRWKKRFSTSSLHHAFSSIMRYTIWGTVILLISGAIPLSSVAAPLDICPSFEITSTFTISYGDVTFNEIPAPVGTVVTAKSPRGDVVGCFIVSNSGKYGAMYIYGEDTSVTPPLPGMRAGETVAFFADNFSAQASPLLTWQNDKDLHQIDLVATGSPAPIANFSALPTSGYMPLEVDFTDLSQGEITSWDWDFGDLETSTDQNPSHTYNLAGRYTISLTVQGPGGSSTRTRTDYISVVTGPPTAGFSAIPRSGIAPLQVSFTNSSTNYSVSLWTFGDNITSSEDHPTHIYTQKGNYTVLLAVLGPGGSASETKTNYIQVYAPAQAAFMVDQTSGYPPLTVNFTNQSTGDFDQLLWDFGDSHSSSEDNPVHTYLAPGVYSVSLNVSGLGGEDTLLLNDLITVYPWLNQYFPLVARQ